MKLDLSVIDDAAQKAFDEKIKPIMVKEMKRLKITRIESVMGVDFITLNNGKIYDEDEFEESSEVRRRFIDIFLRPLWDDPYYRIIDYTVTI